MRRAGKGSVVLEEIFWSPLATISVSGGVGVSACVCSSLLRLFSNAHLPNKFYTLQRTIISTWIKKLLHMFLSSGCNADSTFLTGSCVLCLFYSTFLVRECRYFVVLWTLLSYIARWERLYEDGISDCTDHERQNIRGSEENSRFHLCDSAYFLCYEL